MKKLIILTDKELEAGEFECPECGALVQLTGEEEYPEIDWICPHNCGTLFDVTL